MIRLSDEQWERIRHHFPEEHIPDGRPGRKPIPTRRVLEAVLWILNTGAQWHMLPQSYPSYKTVHRRFQAWCHSEVLRQVLTDIANERRDKGGTRRRRELHRRGLCDGQGRRRGDRADQAWKRHENHGDSVDRHGLPLSVSTHAPWLRATRLPRGPLQTILRQALSAFLDNFNDLAWGCFSKISYAAYIDLEGRERTH
jgi:transposase